LFQQQQNNSSNNNNNQLLSLTSSLPPSFNNNNSSTTNTRRKRVLDDDGSSFSLSFDDELPPATRNRLEQTRAISKGDFRMRFSATSTSTASEPESSEELSMRVQMLEREITFLARQQLVKLEQLHEALNELSRRQRLQQHPTPFPNQTPQQ
jgi:hypothetical protein